MTSPEMMARLGALGETPEGIQEFNRLVFGSPLHPGQLQVSLTATKQVNVLSPGNSYGKSEWVGRDATRSCWRKLVQGRFPYTSPREWLTKDYRVLVTSYQFDIAKESFQRLLHMRDQGGLFATLVADINRSDPPRITFSNGSILDFGSLSEGGRHVEATRRQVIYVDEAGHVVNLKQIFGDVLLPRTMGVGGIIHLIGTPKPNTDPWLYELTQEAAAGDHPRYSFREGSSFENTYWPEEERQRVLDDPLLFEQHVLDRMRLDGANVFDAGKLLEYGAITPLGRQVVLGHFVLAGGLFFQRASVLRLFSGQHDWYVPKGLQVVTAWDLGGSRKGGDATVGVTLDCNEKPWKVTRLEHIPAGDMDWSERYELIQQVQDEDKAHVIGVDVTGAASDAVAEQLEDRGLPIERVNFSGNLGNKKYDLLRQLQSTLDLSWEQEDETGEKVTGKGLVRFPSDRRYPELVPRRKEFDFYRLDDAKLTTDTVIATGMAVKLAHDFLVPEPLFGNYY